MRAIDFKNDVYVLYTGINDRLTAAPVSFYRTDNSHFRKDLYQNVLFSFVELSPRWLLKSKVMKRLFLILGSTDRRNLLDNTTVGEMWRKFPDETEKPAIMNRVNAVAMRNIESMVGVIRAHNPNALILLGSLFHINDPKEIKDLNSALQRYAEEAGLVFVDVAGELPHEEGIVYYDCHFTIEGEKRVATLFANAITDALKKSAPLPPSP